MAGYIVSGALGGGKTLACVGRLREYVLAGKPVATNVDLHLDRLLGGTQPKAPVYRLPDRPTAADLLAIGPVHSTGRESENGCLLLDECGTWLNARSWGDKDRAALIEWFMHSRKYGWDVYFVVQAENMLDKQVREVFRQDYRVRCRRLDRVGVPYLGAVVRWVTFGRVKLTLPAVHVGVVIYGDGHSATIADRWWYKGRDLYGAYETVQVVAEHSDGLRSLLHPGRWAEGLAQRVAARRLRPKAPEVAACMRSVPEHQRCRVLQRVWSAA